MGDPDVKLLAGILLVVVIAAAGWYFRDELLPQPEQPVVAPSLPAIIEPAAEVGPRHPISPPEPPPGQRELVPLPPLDDSDAYFLLALVDVFGTDIDAVLVKDALIDRIVASVDNLPRDHVAEKIRPVGRLPDFFQADTSGDNGPIFLSPENYPRYDPLIGLVATADIGAIVDAYRRFYPLFQEAYQRLGYPDAYFNDRVVEVIDHLLATPEPQKPIRLVRPHVLYEFADPELEALSTGQKLLLRVGPEHAAIVKQFLRELRARVSR